MLRAGCQLRCSADREKIVLDVTHAKSKVSEKATRDGVLIVATAWRRR